MNEEAYDEHFDLINGVCLAGECACDKICAHPNNADVRAGLVDLPGRQGDDLVITVACEDCGHQTTAFSTAVNRPAGVQVLLADDDLARLLAR